MASLSFNYFKKDKSVSYTILSEEMKATMSETEVAKHLARGAKYAPKASVATIFTKSKDESDIETAKAFEILRAFATARGWTPTIQSTESANKKSWCHTVASRPLLNVSSVLLAIEALFPQKPKADTPIIESAPKASKKAPKPLEE